MENMDNKGQGLPGHPAGCFCRGCRWGMGGGHRGFWVLRVFVMLALLLFIFWLGVQIGEIKSFYHGPRGFYGGEKGFMMLQRGPGGYMMGYPNMMYFNTTTPPTTK